MSARLRVAVASLASATLLAAACGSRTSGQTSDSASSCDRLFDALIGCTNAGIPADETTRLRPRWDALCQSALSLPGQGQTPDSLDSCVSAIQRSGCTELGDPSSPCLVASGSLPGGAPCVTDTQCESGACSASTATSDDGGQSACGTCAQKMAIGEPCESRSCGAGATCATTTNGNRCERVTTADVGGTCDGLSKRCGPGLTCSTVTNHCAVPAASGEECTYDADCASPLVCPPGKTTSGSSTCRSPGQQGASCTTDTHCASGLACDPSSATCTALTWAHAGEACGGNVRCLVGACPYPTETGDAGVSAPASTCPAVIADGQPCDERSTTATCDTFAQCTNGVCTVGYANVCPSGT